MKRALVGAGVLAGVIEREAVAHRNHRGSHGLRVRGSRDWCCRRSRDWCGTRSRGWLGRIIGFIGSLVGLIRDYQEENSTDGCKADPEGITPPEERLFLFFGVFFGVFAHASGPGFPSVGKRARQQPPIVKSSRSFHDVNRGLCDVFSLGCYRYTFVITSAAGKTKGIRETRDYIPRSQDGVFQSNTLARPVPTRGSLVTGVAGLRDMRPDDGAEIRVRGQA